MAAAEKQPVTITGAGPLNGALSGLLTWIDQRFPLVETWRKHLHRVLRAEEFQFLVLLRVARALRAGDPDRHRNLPHHELQA